MMNNRSLLTVIIGLITAFHAHAGMEQLAVVTQLVKHVIPYEQFVWGDESTEIIVLVRSKEIGLVQELGVDQTTGVILPRSKFDVVRLMRMEPFVLDGKEFYAAAGRLAGTSES
jgi:hypothetical protein